VNRKRAVLFNALAYAVELGLLDANPVVGVRWRAPKTSHAVDRRSVVNPEQARLLLDTVKETPRSGPRLVAFFALLYYAALRPEEAVALRARDLDLPDEGMGWITIDRAAPDAGKEWTDSGEKRDDRRQLKHRAVGDTRRVPCHPELGRILKEHLRTFGAGEDGRLFAGERSDTLATVTYIRLWDRAREAALTAEQYASPLARRPYDLRHAAVSSWLAAGVAPTRIAEWAGHSVEVLLSVYAKCLDGGEADDIRKLGGGPGWHGRQPPGR
jgi:integrase